MNQSRQVRRQVMRNGTLRRPTVYPRALYRQSKYMPHQGKNVKYVTDTQGNIHRSSI